MNIDKKIKIGFLSMDDPSNKKAWSGTIYQLCNNIQSIPDVEVVWIPVRESLNAARLLRVMKLLASPFKKSYSTHLILYSKMIAKTVDPNLLNSVDLVFAPAGSIYIAYLKTNKPIIYLSDTTFKLIYNYYPNFSNFFNFNVKQANKIEEKAAQNSWKIITSSDWAKNSFVNDYQISKDKIEVLEFGANIDNIQINPNINYIENKILNVLFLGVEWDRKGGSIAVDCVDYLNKQGIKAVLQVVGTKVPDQYKDREYIHELGFLNKNIEDEYSLLKETIYHSDLLLLPTRAECSAIVFSEASAYGLPIFTYDTGGIPNYVVNGVNGYRLPLTSKGKDFAEQITKVINGNELPTLKKGCIEMYREKLNWKHWQSEFDSLLSEYRQDKHI